MIKMAFKHFFVKEKNRSIPAFIYGVDANAISVANALNSKIHFVFECWDLLIITKKYAKTDLGVTHI
jgi:hypothetical protein